MLKQIFLKDIDMPRQWYNVLPDIPNGVLPPLNPETKEPMGRRNWLLFSPWDCSSRK